MGLINPPNKRKRKWWPTVEEKLAYENAKKAPDGEEAENGVESSEVNDVDGYVDEKVIKVDPDKVEKKLEYAEMLKKYKNYVDSLLGKPSAAALKNLTELLEKWKINEDAVDEMVSVTTYAHIAKLLVYYNATQSANDMMIFKVLSFYEQFGHVDLRPIMPLIFGPSTAKHYENLIKLGNVIHICPKADEVLNYFDPEYLWLTGVGIAKFDVKREKQENLLLYDPRFVGLTLLQAVQAGTDLNLKLFIEKNGLSFAFFLTSSPDSNLRAYGYAILADFTLKLKDLTEYGNFEEKSLILYVMNRVRANSQRNARVISFLANFFARSVKILLTPLSPLFPRVVSFFRQNYEIPLNQIPDFFKLMLSTSTEYGIQERCWMLEIIKESMNTADDFEILEKKHGTSLLLGMLASPFVTKLSIRWTLCILKSMIYIPRALDVLMTRLNFHSWIASTIQFARLTRWQIGFLTQIFIAYWRNVRRLHFKKDATKPPEIELMIRETAKIVSSYIEFKEDDIQNKWERKIEWAKQPWKDYEDEVTDEEEKEEVTEESYEKKKQSENQENEKVVEGKKKKLTKKKVKPATKEEKSVEGEKVDKKKNFGQGKQNEGEKTNQKKNFGEGKKKFTQNVAKKASERKNYGGDKKKVVKNKLQTNFKIKKFGGWTKNKGKNQGGK